jgi:hypothetical protein
MLASEPKILHRSRVTVHLVGRIRSTRSRGDGAFDDGAAVRDSREMIQTLQFDWMKSGKPESQERQHERIRKVTGARV